MTNTIIQVSASQNAGPSYGAYNAEPITWSMSRGMVGSIYMKPTDIGTGWSVTWYKAYLTVWLCNPDGSIAIGPVTMEKRYGVTPGWTYIGYAGAGRNFRLRTEVVVNDGTDAFPHDIQAWCEWHASLMWDNLP